jgi:DNA-directed RNA polymerase specialized sigma24 family protein
MKPTTIPTNKQLVGGFNRQETWVIPWLVDRCEAPVYEIASKILKNDVDAEAVTDDVFLKLYSVKKRKKNIKEIGNLLYLSGKNLALDRLKKNHSAQKYLLEKGNGQPVIIEAEMNRNEQVAALYYLISLCKNKLPGTQLILATSPENCLQLI